MCSYFLGVPFKGAFDLFCHLCFLERTWWRVFKIQLVTSVLFKEWEILIILCFPTLRSVGKWPL